MKKIIICDDDITIRELLEAILEDELDAQFILASDGQKALDLLASCEKFDLIICDMNMPSISGDIVYEYNRLHKKIPFVLLSGDCEVMLSQYSGDEFFKVISKPWDEEDLLRTIREFLN